MKFDWDQIALAAEAEASIRLSEPTPLQLVADSPERARWWRKWLDDRVRLMRARKFDGLIPPHFQ